MSKRPRPQRSDGVSRRDFIRGRFWRARQRRLATTAGAPKRTRPKPLVMRYPKTLAEVERVDPSDSETTLASPPALDQASARRRTIPVLRPPGAIEEARFLSECTRCDECRKACPHDAIVHAPPRMREAAGTPMIDADHQACLMCQDFPCIAACEPGVLTSQVPPVMGTAKITEQLCLAHHSTTCTVCSERCPVPGAVHVESGKPIIQESNCTGCGVCRYVCPAPENAILLMPAFIRPLPPGVESHE